MIMPINIKIKAGRADKSRDWCFGITGLARILAEIVLLIMFEEPGFKPGNRSVSAIGRLVPG